MVNSFRRWIFLGLLLGLSVTFASGCRSTSKDTEEVIIVRIPPFVDRNRTAGENQCHFGMWWQPPPDRNIDIIEACKGAGLPNDGVPLMVRFHENGGLTLNGEANGSGSDTGPLMTRLSGIFEERARDHVFVPGTTSVEKSVGIRIPVSARYSDLINVALAVKESGAEPIILLLDGHLPDQELRISNSNLNQ